MISATDISWKQGTIEGCSIRELTEFSDERGWLLELFRVDDLEEDVLPAMAYVSMTRSGVTRGPHEHERQTDLFVFFDGSMRLYLWDPRLDSPTYGHRQTLDFGESRKATVIVPPGVVHAYRNIGDAPALIINCPNRLYAGPKRQESVDEIRHEDDPNSPFQIDAL